MKPKRKPEDASAPGDSGDDVQPNPPKRARKDSPKKSVTRSIGHKEKRVIADGYNFLDQDSKQTLDQWYKADIGRDQNAEVDMDLDNASQELLLQIYDFIVAKVPNIAQDPNNVQVSNNAQVPIVADENPLTRTIGNAEKNFISKGINNLDQISYETVVDWIREDTGDYENYGTQMYMNLGSASDACLRRIYDLVIQKIPDILGVQVAEPEDDTHSPDFLGPNPLEPNDVEVEGSTTWKKQRTELADGFDGKSFHNGPDQGLAPLSELPEIFTDMVKNGIKMLPNLTKAVQHLKKRKLRVATMCSGTESPVTALKIMLECLTKELKLNLPLQFEHLYSAEIVPFKQAFIELNFSPELLFRDIIEMAQSDDNKATTAFGARKDIPVDIDLLVAGFSCVDMSNLNNKKLKLEEMGESGDTLRAIIEYARKHEPKIIILENVDGAPWVPSSSAAAKGEDGTSTVRKTKKGHTITEQWYEAGYYCQYVRLDTKNYYIPHTRVRGYMVCVHMKRIAKNPFYLNHPEAEQFVDVKKDQRLLLQAMENLHRPASEPVEAFLLPETDERVIRGRNEESASSIRAVNWGVCEAEHTSYRQAVGLGLKKPITNWTLGGSCRPHQAISQLWIHNQVERVKDSLDLMYLRNLRRGFDPLFKNRMIDLSQNIDRRSIDTTASGYTGCVTPSGMQFSTVLGRLLVAEEALKLQGMDPDTLNVSLLNQRQLKDLAGNAMSCPTVGAVILAALSLTYKAIPTNSPKEIPEEASESDTIHELTTKQAASEIVFGPLETTLPDNFRRKIAPSLCHCSCEGLSDVPRLTLVKCKDCGHKACTKHNVNPLHNFVPVVSGRLDPGLIISSLEKLLPMSVSFKLKDLPMVLEQLKQAIEEFPFISAGPSKKKQTQPKVKKPPQKSTINNFFTSTSQQGPTSQQDTHSKLLQEIWSKSQTSDIHFKSIDRTTSCLKCYFESLDHEAGALRLELTLSSKGAEWNLYAKVPKTEPGNSALRALLEHPIARMHPSVKKEGNILAGQWELRLPYIEVFDIVIQGVGECVPAFEFLQGLPSFEGVTIWDKLDITVLDRSPIINGCDISGRYTLHQQCGMPMGILYKKEGQNVADHNCVYLFFDPTRYGHPDEDAFVFSTDISPLKFKEVRTTLARLDKKWHPNSQEQSWEGRPTHNKQGKEITAEILGKHHTYQPSEANKPMRVQCSIEGSWRPMEAKLITNAKGTYSYLPGFKDLGRVFPDSEDSMIYELTNMHGKDTDPFGSCYTSIEALDVEVSARNLGIAQTGTTTLNMKEASKFLSKLAFLAKRTPIKEDQVNASNQWHDVSTTVVVGDCGICAAPLPQVKWKLQGRNWTTTEKTKAKRTKFREVPKLSDTLDDKKLVPYEDPQGSINYEKGLKARPSPFVIQYEMDDGNHLRLKIGVNVKTLVHRAAASLPKADARRDGLAQYSYRFSTKCESSDGDRLLPFTIPNNTGDPVAPNPPHFLVDLFEHQAKSLSWMISQEETETHFKEERIVESALNELNWRVEGRASREVKVRGGILADQVGYGKTPLILGLFDSQAPKQPAPTGPPGYMSTAATLIMVPNHLVAQWKNEFDKFVQPGLYVVLVIDTVAKWKDTSVSQILNADLIICPWTLVESEDYLDRVADLSGMLYFPKGAGTRAEKAWYEAATENISMATDTLMSPAPEKRDLLNTLADMYANNWEEAESNSAIKPSFRLRGAARRKAKATAAQRKEDPPSTKEAAREQYYQKDACNLKQLKGWKDLKGPPLEMFHFFRKVVDEYTYVAGQESDTIAHISSDCSWFLSGTPGLNDFVDTWRLMKLLGVDLGQPELTPGIITPQNIKIMSSEQTESEKFRSLLHKPSFAWSRDRHQYAQGAIDTFVRHNVTPINKYPVHNHICAVQLPVIDRAIYSELTFCVAASDMREKKALNALKKIDREERTISIWKREEVTKLAPSAVGALMKCGLVNTSLELDNLVSLRQRQLAEAQNTVKALFAATQFRRSTDDKNHSHYEKFAERIKDNEVGDGDVSRWILGQIQRWHRKVAILNNFEPSDFKIEGKDPPQLRSLCTRLRDACKMLVAAERGLRFLKSVQVLRGRLDNPMDPDETPLDLKGCCSDLNENHLHVPDAVFVECGHLYCEDCINKNRNLNRTMCTKKFCNAPSGYPYLMSKEEFAVDPLPYGINAKLKEIADLIKRMDKKDQVLLFMQFPEQKKMMTNTLSALGISYTNLDTVRDNMVGSTLDSFRRGGKQVLILSIDNVSAAGSNLTNANHVIFAFPYLAPNQTKYETAMTQAIGRVCRHGQKKPIHVYHFVTLKTADVDVFEARNNSILVLNTDTYAPYDLLPADWTAWDDPAHEPNIQNWESSGFSLVKRQRFQVEEGARPPTTGAYSSYIHDMVVRCMDQSLEEGEEGGEYDPDDGEYSDDDDEEE